MRFFSLFMAIYFCIGACIPKCDFNQLLCLSELIGHYQLHVEESKTLGEEIILSEFLFNHFIEVDDHHHDTDSDHEKLPLQNIVQTMTMQVASVLIFIEDIDIKSNQETRFPIPSLIYSPDSQKGVFHPPIC